MALALQSGDASHLQFVAAEQIILAAARAVGASHAAHKQKGHAHRHNDGEEASIRREPVNQAMHIQRHHTLTSETSLPNRLPAISFEFQSAGLPAP
jgi:hypothetical protein